MGLLKQWRDVAYSQQADKAKLQKFWAEYFVIEKGIYEQLLSNPDEVVRGTVKELADKYKVNVMTMTGFLDGINDSLKVQNPIEEMEEDTEVNLGFDKEVQKLEEMIHVHAEAEKNTNSVAEDNKNVKERGEKKLPALFSFM